MNDEERLIITKLRGDGVSMTEISELTGIPYNTIKGFFRRHKNRLPKTMKCLYCGKAIKVTYGKKLKKFCSDNCRAKYWHQHNKCGGIN